ncbi:MAG: hypothetical protein L0332_09505 [Chloroflexi bacterium]|nr:hypothetical protein [Chloroflexota bacterium]MCI0647296.1 hypothetical protein [Chloroflexota bacterium]MCI0726942.1 hypothetical protein [Chloroflexota bacterium]
MSTIQVPAQFSAGISLAQPVKVYRLNSAVKISGLIGILMSLFFAALVLVVIRPLLLNGWGPFASLADPSISGILSIVTLIIPVLLLFPAFIQLIKVASQWNKAIVLYQNGLAFRNRRGLQEWRWEDIRFVQAQIVRYSYYGVPTGTRQTYMFSNHKGEHLVLDQTISQAEELADRIHQVTTPILLSLAAEAYQAGQPVSFGPITVGKQGVTCRGKTYSWDEVQSLSVKDGRVQIEKRGGGFFSGGTSVLASEVYNLTVLLGLLQQIGGNVSFQGGTSLASAAAVSENISD